MYVIILSASMDWFMTNRPFLTTSVTCTGPRIAVTVEPLRPSAMIRPTARPVAKTIFPSWKSLTLGALAANVHDIPSLPTARMAWSPCSMTITPGWYSTSGLRLGATPNCTSLLVSVFGSIAVSTVVPGDACGWSSHAGASGPLVCWVEPVVDCGAAGCCDCDGGGVGWRFLHAAGARAADRIAMAMARRQDTVVTIGLGLVEPLGRCLRRSSARTSYPRLGSRRYPARRAAVTLVLFGRGNEDAFQDSMPRWPSRAARHRLLGNVRRPHSERA